MNVSFPKLLAVLCAGFVAGMAVSNLPSANASVDTLNSELSSREFLVSIDEVKQNIVFGEQFSGAYKRTVKMSDGSERTIELTPMIHDGKQVVEFKDTGGRTYMGLNGTSTNGALMVQIRDMDEIKSQLRAQGWETAANSDG